MEPPSPENSSFDRKTAIRELNRGHELATQLLILLQKPSGDHGSVESPEILTREIFRSFSEALSLLNSGENRDISRDPATPLVSSPCSVSGKIKDSGETKQSPAAKYRKGGYKRRKPSQTWTKLSATPLNDGHGWRKYGQKKILDAKFPRCYFRCTHRNEQGCMATKQVQQTEEEPLMYQITYIGHHTCRDLLKAPPLILDSTPEDTFLLSFESNPMKNKQVPPSFAPLAALNKENKEEMFNDLTVTDMRPCSSMGCFWPSDLMSWESCGPTTNLPAAASTSDLGDVISGGCSPSSSYSIDMDVGIYDMINFDEAGVL